MTQIDRINGLIGSIAVKAPCKAATTANITLSGAQTVDGIALVANNRCLVKNQTDASENGIYDVSSTSWSRAIDFNGLRDIVQGTCVRIISGTVSGQYFYEVTTSDPAIGTTDIDFALVNFPNTTSSFMATLLDDETAAAARATLIAAGTTDNNTFSGTQTFQKTVYWKKGSDITSANDLILNTDGNYNDVTGTTTVNGMTDGVQNEVRKLHLDSSLIFKHDTAPSSGFSKLWLPNSEDYTTSSNGEIEFIYDNAYWRMTSFLSMYSIDEGSWTPAIWDGSNSDAESQTYSYQYGHYSKIGSRVFISGNIFMTSLGSLSTGQGVRIGNLPFISSSTANSGGMLNIGNANGLAITAGYSLGGDIPTGSNYARVYLWDQTYGTTELLLSELSADGALSFEGTYTV